MPDPTPLRPLNAIESRERTLADQLVQNLVQRGVGGERPWEPFLVRGRLDEHGIERGIWLQAKPIPVHLALELEVARPEPQPPLLEIRDQGSEEIRRVEPNPNDPEYQRAHAAWEEQLRIDQQKAILTVGIDVLYADEGFQMPDDEGWANDIELIGIAVGAPGSSQRRLDYLRYYALESTLDLGKTVYRGLLMVGTPELEVARAAAANFRDPSRRPPDQRGATQTG